MNNEDIKTIEQLIDKCKNCTLQECINCEINYNQVQAIKNLLKENKKNDKAKKYILKKQSIQYKYALSKIECEELLKILEGK